MYVRNLDRDVDDVDDELEGVDDDVDVDDLGVDVVDVVYVVDVDEDLMNWRSLRGW